MFLRCFQSAVLLPGLDVKEMASEGQCHIIKIDYINTKFNIADIFTKGVPKEVLDALEQYLCGKANLNDLLEKNMEWNASRTLDQAKEPDKTNEKERTEDG